MRLEIRRLRAEGARGRPQSSPADLSAAPIAEQRVAARERTEESQVSLKEFLRYDTPEFRGEDGEDPQGFLRETEKVMKRLPCSEARVIELVGIKMKDNA